MIVLIDFFARLTNITSVIQESREQFFVRTQRALPVSSANRVASSVDMTRIIWILCDKDVFGARYSHCHALSESSLHVEAVIDTTISFLFKTKFLKISCETSQPTAPSYTWFAFRKKKKKKKTNRVVFSGSTMIGYHFPGATEWRVEEVLNP